jgi:hypothetical protein
MLRRGVRGLAIMHRLILEVVLHDQADEASEHQDEHHRGRDQRNRQDRPPDLSFGLLPQTVR